ncbi:enolase [Caldalkalibacillus uzonensis]|uniref:Enolase n=1 Tax=Caldalkalibacillus uzonensis TaxID=353224 RepID=A0ABU0CUQ7_9BACI|nr:phosphopyruvate hydratase [Caldalkalibacillus uzonensis]MDQ0340064.1 enolase [Caldalkalibacillus uzonensis]
MNRIKSINGREILDSRGNPTVEVEVLLESGDTGRMMVPSGASTGKYEAWELRDGDLSRFRGMGVLSAVKHVNEELAAKLIGMDAEEHEAIDYTMIEMDGTANKSRLGANAILGVSFAVIHAVAKAKKCPLYLYIAQKYFNNHNLEIPLPMVNMISGGLHAGKNIDLQDFLIIPIGAMNFPHALEIVSNVFWNLKQVLEEKGYQSSLFADEGGFGPQLSSHREALELLLQAVEMGGLLPGKDVMIALDVAASHFYHPEDGMYHLKSENRILSSLEMIDLLEKWVNEYPILSIEDGLAEEDWEGWKELTRRLGHRVQLIGDDLFATNPQRIKMGVKEQAGDAVLIKMNQIGTFTETIAAIKLAQQSGMNTIISARSGETEDATLSDLAVGVGGGQIKIGSRL